MGNTANTVIVLLITALLLYRYWPPPYHSKEAAAQRVAECQSKGDYWESLFRRAIADNNSVSLVLKREQNTSELWQDFTVSARLSTFELCPVVHLRIYTDALLSEYQGPDDESVTDADSGKLLTYALHVVRYTQPQMHSI